MTIESNRSLGGTAAILILIGVVSQIFSLFQYIFPSSTGISIIFNGVSGIFSVLSFVGFLLFFIAMYGFSKDYKEERIFSYILYGLIITIVAAVIVAVIFVLVILFNFANLFPNFSSSAPSSSQISSEFAKTFGLIFPLFSLVGVIWVVFNVRAFNLLANKSKVHLFKTGAKALLAGALVNIVFAIIFAVVGFYIAISLNILLALLIVGGLVQDAAWLLLARAYFRIQVPAPSTQAVPSINVSPVLGQVKYCPNCGAPNLPDAAYCTRCGQKL